MTILITGASRGIGYAIAQVFAQRGYTLALVSRQQQPLAAAAKQLQTQFPDSTIRYFAADLALPESAVAVANWCKLEGLVPDVLVNNAGYFLPGAIHNEAEGNLEQQLQVNLLSAYRLTRTLLPDMISRKSGHIFNMCSVASLKAYPNGGSYSISKFALYGFSQNLREELKPLGIKVTSVMPGATWSDSWAGFDAPEDRLMEARDIALMMYQATQLSTQAVVEEITLRPQLGDL